MGQVCPLQEKSYFDGLSSRANLRKARRRAGLIVGRRILSGRSYVQYKASLKASLQSTVGVGGSST